MNWMAFYNYRRLHSSLGYLSPIQYEKRWYEAQRKRPRKQGARTPQNKGNITAKRLEIRCSPSQQLSFQSTASFTSTSCFWHAPTAFALGHARNRRVDTGLGYMPLPSNFPLTSTPYSECGVLWKTSRVLTMLPLKRGSWGRSKLLM